MPDYISEVDNDCGAASSFVEALVPQGTDVSTYFRTHGAALQSLELTDDGSRLSATGTSTRGTVPCYACGILIDTPNGSSVPRWWPRPLDTLLLRLFGKGGLA